MSDKAIWWVKGVFYPTKKVAVVYGEPDRIAIPCYCNPIQLADFLNKLDEKYKR